MSSPETNTPAAANACQRELSISVPADEVRRETETVIQKYSKLARIPGFRKGKVPAGVVRNRFAEEIKSEVVEALIPRAFRAEVEKQKLQPVSQPRVTDLKMEEGQPLHFKAAFEVLPDIEVSDYQELRPEKPDTKVTEEEVDAALNQLREQASTYQTLDDRKVAKGDFAEISFSGTPKEKTEAEQAAASSPEAPSPEAKLDEVLVEVGGENTVKEFTEHLTGAKAGDERKFDVKYADDFGDQRLAGKSISYHVKVKSVKQKQTPELNDDFAKEVGSFDSVDALRKQVRENMEHEKQHQAEHHVKEKLIEDLVAKNDFPVPESMVERAVDARLERGLRALAAQGMRTEDMRKLDFNRLRAGQREAALREVKASLILDKIADKEKIEVSDDDVDKEITIIASQSQQPTETIRARLTKEGALDRIRDKIRNEKALAFLLNRSA
ncbi:MAG: trigger factor [Candidatus Koribacter versatilis]|uniref:Trigger factor n=1 Tax=Candidatus Korobacter versatilis TaxID=658062 RepID=A0A932A634_9BACT|nr:trigger factor [Candidatus Koribacter versatilis]